MYEFEFLVVERKCKFKVKVEEKVKVCVERKKLRLKNDDDFSEFDLDGFEFEFSFEDFFFDEEDDFIEEFMVNIEIFDGVFGIMIEEVKEVYFFEVFFKRLVIIVDLESKLWLELINIFFSFFVLGEVDDDVDMNDGEVHIFLFYILYI